MSHRFMHRLTVGNTSWALRESARAALRGSGRAARGIGRDRPRAAAAAAARRRLRACRQAEILTAWFSVPSVMDGLRLVLGLHSFTSQSVWVPARKMMTGVRVLAIVAMLLSIVDVRTVQAQAQPIGNASNALPAKTTDWHYHSGRDLLQWCVVSPMEQIFPDWEPPSAAEKMSRAVLDGGTGEHLAFQFSMRPSTTLRDLSVVASPLQRADGKGLPIPAAAVSPPRRVLRVNVTTGANGSTQWPDPLPFLSPTDQLDPGTTSALWIIVTVPPGAQPGVYTGNLQIHGSDSATGRIQLAHVPVDLTVRNISVVNRTLRTDSKLSDQWIHHYAQREPDGGNLTAVMLRYYQELVDHRVTMMGWGGVSIFPPIAAKFSSDLRAVSLNTSEFDAMAAALEEMGIEQLHFPLPSQCSCCEPITHIRTPIPQVIPTNATWWLAGAAPDEAIQVFDSLQTTLDRPVLNTTFITGFTTLVREISAHLTSRGWLTHMDNATASNWSHHLRQRPRRLNANYMLFIDEVDITDPFTARALLVLDTFFKQVEPRLQLAQTRFPTNQYGKQNHTLVLPPLKNCHDQISLELHPLNDWLRPGAGRPGRGD